MIEIPFDACKVRDAAKPLEYAHEGDSGIDVYVAAVSVKPFKEDLVCEEYSIYPGDTVLVKTGWHVAIPKGTEFQCRPTSGNSLKTAIRICNSPGTIDSNYRGEIGVIVQNTGDETIKLKQGAKIAQIVLCPVYKGVPHYVDTVEELGQTNRGADGYGSTGTILNK